jgi:hypothetical protein
MRALLIPGVFSATIALTAAALAQGGGGGGSSAGGAGGGASAGGAGSVAATAGSPGALGTIPSAQAPLGQRQPRRSDMPSGNVGEAPASTQSTVGVTQAPRDPAVERTLNSICRGC